MQYVQKEKKLEKTEASVGSNYFYLDGLYVLIYINKNFVMLVYCIKLQFSTIFLNVLISKDWKTNFRSKQNC